MMFQCVECFHEGNVFHAGVAESMHHGALTYFAKCPKCGSFKVKHLPGYKESDLRIGVGEEERFMRLLPMKPREGPPLPRILDIKWPGSAG